MTDTPKVVPVEQTDAPVPAEKTPDAAGPAVAAPEAAPDAAKK